MGWGIAAAGLGSALGGLMGGGGPEQRPMHTGMMVPEQAELLRKMIAAYQGGSGEFGFGPAATSGMATWRNMMGQRGIGLDSGVAQGGFAQMMAQAMGMDSQNRGQFGMGLIGAQPGSLFNYDRLGTGMRQATGGYDTSGGSYGFLRSLLNRR